MACHHSSWTTHTVGQRQSWHDIIVLGKHTWSENVGCGIPSWPFKRTHGRMMSGVEIPSSPFDCTHKWIMLVGMSSSPLDNIYGRTKLGMAIDHCRLTRHTVGRYQAWYAIIALGQHIQLESLADHHSPCTAHAGGRHQAWHAIITLGQRTVMDDVGPGIPSSP